MSRRRKSARRTSPEGEYGELAGPLRRPAGGRFGFERASYRAASEGPRTEPGVHRSSCALNSLGSQNEPVHALSLQASKGLCDGFFKDIVAFTHPAVGG